MDAIYDDAPEWIAYAWSFVDAMTGRAYASATDTRRKALDAIAALEARGDTVMKKWIEHGTAARSILLAVNAEPEPEVF